jgi:hypothetical protein
MIYAMEDYCNEQNLPQFHFCTFTLATIVSFQTFTYSQFITIFIDAM